MKKISESEVRTGRPFGGTGFLFNKKHSNCIKPMVNYYHERVSVMNLSADVGEIVLINGYLPFYKTSDLQNQRIIYQETLAYIENIINDHLGSHFILLLDMNCNIYNTGHPYSILLRDLMSRKSLFSAFDLVPNFDPSANFTRCDLKTNSFTLIDGILLSDSLRDLVSNVRISDYGDNVSDHRPVELDLDINLCEIQVEKKILKPTVNWNRITSESIQLYQDKMSEELDKIVMPFSLLLHGDKCCSSQSHVALIESYYQSIERSVLFADSFLPRSNPVIHKPYWSAEISELKQKSIDCTRIWRNEGCPRNGPVFLCKKRCCLKYKQAIRTAKKNHENAINDELYDNLTSHDNDSFWKVWRNHNKEADSIVTRVDGETTQEGISGAFRNHFRRVYSNHSTPAHESLKEEFHDKFASYYGNHWDDSIAPYYLSWSEMLDIMGRLECGKSSSGRIRPEHIMHCSRKLGIHLLLLFNAMIQHGIVVADFLKGTITPIIKDSQGDVSDCTNYRGITLGILFSKMFEFALDIKLEPYLVSDPLQFGFKKRTSTSHALYTLKSAVNYFNNHGSDAFVAFLDCSKAFDRISHYGLFIKLMEQQIPLCLLLIIIFWHIGMTCRVKWGEVFSEEFDVPLGTKQGGISSPKFFSLYINDLIGILRNSGVGCHLIRLFIGCILFADDLALIAPTRKALQKMIALCQEYCDRYCLDFNTKKSKIMIFGKSYNENIAPLRLSNEPIEIVSEWKYLGTTLVSGKRLSFSARPDLSSFFRATNAVINVLKGAHEHTLMMLLHSNCVPILTYACAVKQYSSSDMSDCDVAMNSAFRKSFGLTDYLSIRPLRASFGFTSLDDTFKDARDRFLISCLSHPNPIVSRIALYNLN